MAAQQKTAKKRSSILWPILLVGFGLIFLLNGFGWTNIDVDKLWPLVLIIPGIHLIYDHSK